MIAKMSYNIEQGRAAGSGKQAGSASIAMSWRETRDILAVKESNPYTSQGNLG